MKIRSAILYFAYSRIPSNAKMADLGGNTCSDDEPQLSEHTLLALQEFYTERMQLCANPTGLSEIEENWASAVHRFYLALR